MLDLDERKVEGFAKEIGLQETVFGATCHILGARFHTPFPQLLFIFFILKYLERLPVHSNLILPRLRSIWGRKKQKEGTRL